MAMINYPFSQQALGQILEDKAKTRGNQAFLQFKEGPEVTFAMVNETTNRIANGLLKLGLKKGDKIATLLPNCLECIYLWFGAAKAGIIEVPVNLANKGDFLAHIINNSDSKVIIISHDLIDRVKFIENSLPKIEKVVIWGKDSLREDLPKLKFEVLNYDDLLTSSSEKPQVDIKASDPQIILYTSGTTGPAKGVIEHHAGLYIGASNSLRAIRAKPNDVFFTCLPLFHGNARINCVYPALVLGAKVVIYERFSASQFWDWIRKSKATTFNVLGAMASFIYNQPRKEDDGKSGVRVCIAAPMPKEIHQDFEKRFNLRVLEGYGLSELGNLTVTPFDAPRLGSCGKSARYYDVKIVDENDFPVPAGTVGEIVARGKIPWVMSLGYYNIPEKTVELTRNHYYHTGDAGYLDNDGYLYFVDRIKDYIRRRGENISSFEVERTVNSHPKVSESAAIGIKSELSEDEVKISVVLKEGEKLTPEELLDFCQERMPYFAIPRYVEFVKSLPKTPTDRVRKNLLRENGITDATWDREKAGYKVKR